MAIDTAELCRATFAELSALRQQLDAQVWNVPASERASVRRALRLVTAVRAYRFPAWRESPGRLTLA